MAACWLFALAASLAPPGAAADELPRIPREHIVSALDGRSLRPFELSPGEHAVVVFTTRDCPIANSFAPEVRRVCDRYQPRGVRCLLVYVDPTDRDGRALLERHRAEYYGAALPAAHDPGQALAARLGVTATPEGVVIDAQGQARYRGRINDRYPALGRIREAPQRHDLRLALDQLLAGQPVSPATTEAVGCALPLPPDR